MFIVKRRSDGLYLRKGAAWWHDNNWVPDVAKAKVYTSKGHPKTSPILLAKVDAEQLKEPPYPCGKNPPFETVEERDEYYEQLSAVRKENKKRRDEAFEKVYELVPVQMQVIG